MSSHIIIGTKKKKKFRKRQSMLLIHVNANSKLLIWESMIMISESIYSIIKSILLPSNKLQFMKFNLKSKQIHISTALLYLKRFIMIELTLLQTKKRILQQDSMNDEFPTIKQR